LLKINAFNFGILCNKGITPGHHHQAKVSGTNGLHRIIFFLKLKVPSPFRTMVGFAMVSRMACKAAELSFILEKEYGSR
jgi:hypothetical protein